MKTHEYVKKYHLDQSDKFNHSLFVEDLTNDFVALLELNKALDNIKGFENALRCIRMKFDAISNKTLGILPEKLWNYFFATIVVKLREELCPKDMEKRRVLHEERQKIYQERQAQKKWEQEQFENFYYDNYFRSFWGGLISTSVKPKPVESFALLGLPDNALEEDVKSAFRKLSLLYHPDKGGKQDKFIEITEAKNKCLNWLKQ